MNSDLISNTLTGVRPDSVVVKLINSNATSTFTGTTCNNSAALAGLIVRYKVAGGLLAFGTTVHPAPVAGTSSVTETPFSNAHLGKDELLSITGRCANIIGNGSGFGICRSCRSGGLSVTSK